MNTHLNLFKSYSRENRDYQLENDLTRALAICLMEDSLLLHELLQFILKDEYNKLFSHHRKGDIIIDIQKNVSSLNGFSHLFAVSLSEYKMLADNFFKSSHNAKYDPITDMIITIHDIAIIFEVKPNNTDCTSQLYNQALNANDKIVTKETVTPVDLNWKDLMEMIISVSNYQSLIGKQSRFLVDFIDFVKLHNYRWLPQVPFSQQSFKGKLNKAYERLDAGVANAKTSTIIYSDRHGFSVNFNWASEILFDCIHTDKEDYLRAYIWPGNTKGQGWSLFPKSGEPNFKSTIKLLDEEITVQKIFHIKFSHFQKYVTCLEGTDSDLLKSVVNAENFRSISGKKKRDSWKKLEDFFDEHFTAEFNWRDKCGWKSNFWDSNRSYFDLALGYRLSIDVPLTVLQQIDTQRDNLLPLSDLLDEIHDEFKKVF